MVTFSFLAIAVALARGDGRAAETATSVAAAAAPVEAMRGATLLAVGRSAVLVVVLGSGLRIELALRVVLVVVAAVGMTPPDSTCDAVGIMLTTPLGIAAEDAMLDSAHGPTAALDFAGGSFFVCC